MIYNNRKIKVGDIFSIGSDLVYPVYYFMVIRVYKNSVDILELYGQCKIINLPEFFFETRNYELK